MKRFSLIILISTIIICKEGNAQSVYSVGPMLHINIGNKHVKASFGFELAYWSFSHTLPYGCDIGIEHQKSKWRVYTEAQAGIIWGGISAGPCLEIRKDSSCKMFIQTSIWANALIGIDLRFRYSESEHYFAPGLYAKFPFTPGGWDSFNDEYDKNHSSTSNNHISNLTHHHH